MNQGPQPRMAGEWGQGNEEQRTKGFSFPCLHSLAILFFAASLHAAPPRAELVSVQKIWDRAPHNGFTDLIRFRGQFFCCFREGLDHVGGDGVIRILASADGEHWADQAGVSEEGVDLRESKLAAAETHVVLLRMTATSLDPILKLPSGGSDCGYTGLLWHHGLLWVTYNSSHEGKTNIYLAKVRILIAP